jgi:hypothetical protein
MTHFLLIIYEFQYLMYLFCFLSINQILELKSEDQIFIKNFHSFKIKYFSFCKEMWRIHPIEAIFIKMNHQRFYLNDKFCYSFEYLNNFIKNILMNSIVFMLFFWCNEWFFFFWKRMLLLLSFSSYDDNINLNINIQNIKNRKIQLHHSKTKLNVYIYRLKERNIQETFDWWKNQWSVNLRLSFTLWETREDGWCDEICGKIFENQRQHWFWYNCPR